MGANKHYLALAGGVGGARLAHGLATALAPGALTVAVNTGDDFEHLGLHIAPDLDTVMYTLAGINNPDTGWGIAGETWRFMAALERLGGETWFRLGDQDLATHVERTRRLAAGETLTGVTAALCRRLGIAHRVVPMSDDAVRTVVLTADGRLPFQDYFVRLQCAPAVAGFEFAGIAEARPSPPLAAVLDDPALSAVIICPSNPFVSVAPITGMPAMARFLEARRVPVIAVSPIVGGVALKGPAAKMMGELGIEPTAAGIAAHYGDMLDGLVIDTADAALAGAIEARGPRVLVTGTVMRSRDDKTRLAEAVVAFAETLEPAP